MPIREINGTSSLLVVNKTRHPRVEPPSASSFTLKHKERGMKKTLLICLLLAITTFGTPSGAGWLQLDDGRFTWSGEIPGTHRECIDRKLLTVECFYKVHKRVTGYKGKKLDVYVNLERDPTMFTHAVCAEYFWYKPYLDYIECRRMLLNNKKNSEGNRRFRQDLEKLTRDR